MFLENFVKIFFHPITQWNSLWRCLSNNFKTSFPGYFSGSPELNPGCPDPGRPPQVFIFTLFTFDWLVLQDFYVTSLFHFTACDTVLTGCLLSTRVFFLFCTLFSYCDTFLLKCDHKHPIEDLPLCLISKSCPLDYSMVWNYWCSTYMIILPIAPISHYGESKNY